LLIVKPEKIQMIPVKTINDATNDSRSYVI